VNLAVTERSVRLVFAVPGAGPAARSIFLLRFFAVVAAVVLALRTTDVAPIPFVIGLLVIVPAALWHGLSQAREA